MPYSWSDLPFFLCLPVLLVFSAFFSASETALFTLTAHQRLQLTSRTGVTARALNLLLRDPRTLLVLLMLGNMVANTLYFVITTVLLLKVDPKQVGALGVAAISLLPLVAIILLGEVLPKLAANTLRVPLARLLCLPLAGIYPVIGPVARAASRWIVEPIGRLLAPSRRGYAPAQLDTAELEALLEMSQQRGVIGTDEQQLIRQVLTLSHLKVRDIMVPRVDVVAIDVREPAEALRRLADRTGLNKVLAIDGDIDHVLGVIYVRQFMLASRRDPRTPLRSLVRNVRFVPELQRVDQLLDDFRGTGTKLAIAVDEYGGTAGLVTLKDVVERMVGDVDMDQVVAGMPLDLPQPLGIGTWRVSGRLSVHDWEDAFGAHDLPRRVSTVGGLVMALLGRVPRVGDVARLANLSLEVERMDGDRVESVLLRLTGPDGQPLWQKEQPR